MAVTVRPSPQSQRARHFRRWDARWPGTVADSFSRQNRLDLSSAETGQDWQAYASGAVANPWEITSRHAEIRTATLGTYWALVHEGFPDATIKAKITIRTVFGNGVGLAFRGTEINENCLVFRYESGTTYRLSSWDGTTATTIDTRTGSALSSGTEYLFEVRCVGSTIELYIDGTQVGADITSSTFSTQYSSGIWVDSPTGGNPFHEFRHFRHFRRTAL